jgi:hypothetical protein
MSEQKAEKFVSVHTSGETTPDEMQEFIDHGQLAFDLAKTGLSLVLTNKKTFTEDGAVKRPIWHESGLSFRDDRIDPDRLSAMHVRLLPKINVEGSEAIPKLNSNEVKDLARDKYDMYRRVLHDYQVPTELLSVENQTFDEMVDTIAAVDGDQVVIKKNTGSSGYSTKVLEKFEAVDWLSRELTAEGGMKPHILQPKIEFGRLPADITTSDQRYNGLVERAKREKLLTELRMFVVKRGDQHDLTPVLRIVPDEKLRMEGQNDVYVDTELPDDLERAVNEATIAITDKLSGEVGGEKYMLGAVDYYFDKHGMPHVMEANFRSPQLPVSRDNPVAGQDTHQAVAMALADMANERK